MRDEEDMSKMRDLLDWLRDLRARRRPRLHFVVAEFNHKERDAADTLWVRIIELGKTVDLAVDAVVVSDPPPFPVYVKLRLDTLAEKERDGLMRTFAREAGRHGCREVYESVELAR